LSNHRKPIDKKSILDFSVFISGGSQKVALAPRDLISKFAKSGIGAKSNLNDTKKDKKVSSQQKNKEK